MSNQEKLKTDPRIKRTKKMFKEALISLIQEHEDASKLTVQMIADRAELNRATFYLHYHDIHDLMEQMIEEVFEELNDTMKSSPEGQRTMKVQTPPGKLVSFLEHFYRNARLYNVMLENKDFRKRVFGILLDIVTYSEVNRRAKGQSFQLPKEILVASSLGIITWWIQEGTPYSPSYLAELIMQRFNN
ncbi:TetR/AcrR family transcriptional regulator [Bacillus sp. ISL-18]|uniref:TetR/AcrR family transcriptional regulator n=1 Tax=Bacillus sp. ISL-18 TaxID=2819118 RepID=UPI001BE68BC8|nr:TetR-like C-terminal domain-containing protein [Bacillus sp. ISL-18]MBT2658910.1 TetR/AcrR family transcriptional regulator [Bacillus sp. ISL-18]